MSEAVTIDTIKNILTKNVNKEYSLSREEAIAIMNLPEDDMPLLMEMAGSLRKKYKGNHAQIHYHCITFHHLPIYIFQFLLLNGKTGHNKHNFENSFHCGRL